MDPSRASALARDPSTPADTLEILTGLGLPFLCQYVAVHPNATPALLAGLTPATLSTDNDVALARALTMNEGTPADVLSRLLDLLRSEQLNGTRRENHPFEEVALRILSHPNCPEQAAERVLNTRELPRSFRVSLAQSVAAVAILEALAADASAVVSAVASERLRKIGEHLPSAPN
jgi:hypothetical protein